MTEVYKDTECDEFKCEMGSMWNRAVIKKTKVNKNLEH